jgi:hypothetical protein
LDVVYSRVRVVLRVNITSPLSAAMDSAQSDGSLRAHGDSGVTALLLRCLSAYSFREVSMIRKLKSGEYRLYSRKKNPKTGKRRNLGTFKSRSAAEKHERAVQYFKHA